MIIFVARLILFLTPVVFAILWVRNRLAKAGDDVPVEDMSAADQRLIRHFLIALSLLAGSALLLYFSDGTADKAGKVYIPPHVVDGEMVKGRFVPADSPEAEEARRKGQLAPASRPDENDG